MHTELQNDPEPQQNQISSKMPMITEYEDPNEMAKQYVPQPSITPSHMSQSDRRRSELSPSKPIRSQIGARPIRKQSKKRTIFDSDSTYSANKRPRSFQQNAYKNTGQPSYRSNLTKDYITDSAFPPSQMTEKDPYADVINYSELPVIESRQEHLETDYVPGGGAIGKEKLPFYNFVDEMAKRNSLHRNKDLRYGKNQPNTMKNSNEFFHFNQKQLIESVRICQK